MRLADQRARPTYKNTIGALTRALERTLCSRGGRSCQHMGSQRTLSTQHIHDMESSQRQQEQARVLPQPVPVPVCAAYYLSPPEETPIDSFTKDADAARGPWASKLAPIQTGPSPPASPDQRLLPRIPALNTEMSHHSVSHDPPLFPATQLAVDTAPLFSDASQQSDERHDSFTSTKGQQNLGVGLLKKSRSKARRSFGWISPGRTGTDLEEYLYRNIDEVRRIPGNMTRLSLQPQEPPVTTARFDDYTATLKRSLHRTGAGIAKTRTSPPKAQATKPAKISIPAAPRKPTKIANLPRERKSPTAEPEKRKRAPPSKHAPLKEDDKLWASLPDYSPPISTLDGKPKALKVTWRGSPNDLSSDPDIHAMHPQEVEAAAELKLPAAQYLANKRRIFQAKVASLQAGKTFTKTAAQQACNIDVNKTSKLWEAYDKIGWFDEEHFQKWL